MIPLMMHLEKHSRAKSKAFEILFLTISGYTSQEVANFFEILHFTVVYLNVTEQWPLCVKTNFSLIKFQSRRDV